LDARACLDQTETHPAGKKNLESKLRIVQGNFFAPGGGRLAYVRTCRRAAHKPCQQIKCWGRKSCGGGRVGKGGILTYSGPKPGDSKPWEEKKIKWI